MQHGKTSAEPGHGARVCSQSLLQDLRHTVLLSVSHSAGDREP